MPGRLFRSLKLPETLFAQSESEPEMTIRSHERHITDTDDDTQPFRTKPRSVWILVCLRRF